MKKTKNILFDRPKRLLAMLMVVVMLLAAFGNIPLTAFAAAVDVSGSYVIDQEDGSFTLKIKGIASLTIKTGDMVDLICTDMAYDFTGAVFTTTAPFSGGGGMNQITFVAQSVFTIPVTGLEINISGISYLGFGTGDTMDLRITGENSANETIPVFRGQGPDETDIALAMSVSATSFSPDWEGKLSTPLTVTIKANDNTASGRVVLYIENGPVTLLNGQSYLYADMVNGTATATINKLVDMAGLSSPFSVDLKASMPLYDTVSNAITLTVAPNPLSITGTVLDEGGNKITGAAVCLLTADGFMASRTYTGASGEFLLYGSPKSSSYRVIATYNDLYGEVTKDLLPQPATATIVLYSHIKVEVNFYRNKATLDGTPNNNVVSSANLYAEGTYTVEAYTDAAGKNPIAPNKTDGRSVFFTMAELLNLGGKLYVKAVPYSKYQDPFIDCSSALTEVDYAAAPDPHNITLNLEESPVGTITIKNTGERAFSFWYESGTGVKYTEQVISVPAGGIYTFVTPESYQMTANPVQVWIGAYGRGDRFLATVSMGRRYEIEMSAEEAVNTSSGWGHVLSAGKQFGDLVPIAFNMLSISSNGHYTIELPDNLELLPDWKDYVTLAFCAKGITLTAQQINATYNSANNTLSFSFYALFGQFIGMTINQTDYQAALTSYFATYCPYPTAGAIPCVFNFAVKAKVGTADIMSHHVVASLTGGIAYDDQYIPPDRIYTNFRYTSWRSPLCSLSFTTGHPLTLEAPSATNTDKVFVQGYAKPGASVTVSADGYGALRTLTANPAGRYSGTVTLPDIQQTKDIKLVATSADKTSNKLTIRYSKRLLYTQELWMTSKQAGMFDKTYLLINNSVNYIDDAPSIVDAQSGKTQNIMLGDDVKFCVKMSDNSSVQKVFVSLETADGSSFGSIPCLYNSTTGYWESSKQNGMSFGSAASYRVTYVLNIGHEYISPAEIEANMSAGEAALAAYVTPERMLTAPEAYKSELQLAMVEAMPPEFRNADYAKIGGGKKTVTLNIGGQNVSFDQTLEQITGAELDALSAKAQTDGIKLGEGSLYFGTKYICTLLSGSTKTYTQKEFDNALIAQSKLYPNDTIQQLMTDRLKIASVIAENVLLIRLPQTASPAAKPVAAGISSMAEPVLGERVEAVRSRIETASNVLGMIGGAAVKPLAGVVNALSSLASIPDNIVNAWDSQAITDGYKAMNDNMRNLQNSECYAKLTSAEKTGFNNLLAKMDSHRDGMDGLKWRQTAHSIAMSTWTIASAAITLTGAGGTLLQLGNSIASLLGGNTDILGKEFMAKDLDTYKKIYEEAQEWNDIMKEGLALACGYKESDKSQGNYNFIYDPQGVVYDGTLDYPVSGVRCELWTANDGSGTGARFWDEAADYDQINPQITEADGMFSWFTPEGWWQVRIFDTVTGAELGRSEWLKVLPAHYGVNINIGKEPFKITYEGNGGFLQIPELNSDELASITAFPQTVFLVPQGKTHAAVTNVFIREGYTFAGWNTKADGSGTAYGLGSEITATGDVTLYAQWTKVKTGLPTGAVVGIVLGSVALLGAAGFCVYWFVIRKKKNVKNTKKQ